MVLHDIERRTETDLGPGRLPVFTADGKYLVWASQAGSAQAFEVEGGVQLDLGVRGLPRALTGDRVWVQADDENYEVAIGTGIRRALPAPPAEGVRPRPQDAGRWRLVRVYPPPREAREPLFDLVDGSGVLGTARFEARSAVLTSDGRLFLATPPVQLDDQAGVIRGLVGWSNVFEVNPETLTASFIASARISQALFPFAANERYVAWTEDFCNIASFESLGRVSSFPDSNGRTRIYDRQSGTLTELDQGLLVDGLTPRGGWRSARLGRTRCSTSRRSRTRSCFRVRTAYGRRTTATRPLAPRADTGATAAQSESGRPREGRGEESPYKIPCAVSRFVDTV